MDRYDGFKIKSSHWPEKELLRTNVPCDFMRAFGDKVATIIDCFEIFIYRPSNLLARAMT